MRKLFFLLAVVASLTLTACSTVLNNLPGVYSLEIQQGNMVDQDMINQLKPGMSKRQVLYIMGSPMLMDIFHQKRWDYLYSRQVEGDAREQKRVSLYFEGDVLSGVQGDFRPDIQADRAVKETTVDVPPRDLEKTLWEKIVSMFSDEPDTRSYKSAAEEAKIDANKKAASEEAEKPDTHENISAKPVLNLPVK